MDCGDRSNFVVYQKSASNFVHFTVVNFTVLIVNFSLCRLSLHVTNYQSTFCCKPSKVSVSQQPLFMHHCNPSRSFSGSVVTAPDCHSKDPGLNLGHYGTTYALSVVTNLPGAVLFTLSKFVLFPFGIVQYIERTLQRNLPEHTPPNSATSLHGHLMCPVAQPSWGTLGHMPQQLEAVPHQCRRS